jgi:hypothetical protein
VTSIVNRAVADGNGNFGRGSDDKPRGRCRLGLSGSRRGPNPVTRWTALGTTEGNLSFSVVHHSYMKYASSSLRVLLIICSSCVLLIICCSRVLLSIAVVHHAYLYERENRISSPNSLTVPSHWFLSIILLKQQTTNGLD